MINPLERKETRGRREGGIVRLLGQDEWERSVSPRAMVPPPKTDFNYQ